MNFNSINGRAVIKGKVTYEPGFQKGASKNELIMQKVAAAGAVVTVEVKNTSISAVLMVRRAMRLLPTRTESTP